MNKRDLNERDICSKFITPAILKAGWDMHTQSRGEVGSTLRFHDKTLKDEEGSGAP